MVEAKPSLPGGALAFTKTLATAQGAENRQQQQGPGREADPMSPPWFRDGLQKLIRSRLAAAALASHRSSSQSHEGLRRLAVQARRLGPTLNRPWCASEEPLGLCLPDGCLLPPIASSSGASGCEQPFSVQCAREKEQRFSGWNATFYGENAPKVLCGQKEQ
jgi:hypothetical protein